MGTALALLAACALALGAVLQQRGTMDTTSASGDTNWLIQILRKPVWLAGMLLGAVGWLFQAGALDRAPLVVVQSLTTLSLVIALPFGVWLTNQEITRRVVIGAISVVAGIVLFLSAGAPKGGTTHPSAQTWWIAGLITVALVVTLGVLASKREGAVRALWFGIAAGFCFAFQSAVTKEFVTEIGGGVLNLLGDWTTYALIVSGLVGFVLAQTALRTGVLAPAMASSNAVTLFAGIVLGLTVFGETLTHSDGGRVPAIVGLGIALVGVALLGGADGPDPAQQAESLPVEEVLTEGG
jgi:drug/metabolite transporter (DMT)-like permease